MDLTALRLLWALSEMEYGDFRKDMAIDHHAGQGITSDNGAGVATGTYQKQEKE